MKRGRVRGDMLRQRVDWIMEQGGKRGEAQLASKILNTMTRLGMPDSYRKE